MHKQVPGKRTRILARQILEIPATPYQQRSLQASLALFHSLELKKGLNQQEGEQVLAYNEAQQANGDYPITQVIHHQDHKEIKLSLRGPDGQTEVIETTAEHSFYVSTPATQDQRPAPVGHEELNTHWVGAGHLQTGDKLKLADGRVGEVLNVTTLQKTQEMFNLTVEEAHTFFVGNSGWLVHNQTFPCLDTLVSKAQQLAPTVKNNLTRAGRALQKHANRPGTVFPKPNTQNPAGYNSLGLETLKEIITNPNTELVIWKHLNFGMVIEFRNLTKGGARFRINGDMIGFLNPNPAW